MEKIELIDRAAVRSLAYVSSDWSHGAHPLVVELSDIDDLPTIDAAPVRRGVWNVCKDVDGNEYGKCSYCGGETYDGDNDTFDQPPDFCQHCGANMRRDENE